MAEQAAHSENIDVTFLRKRDYKLIRELGQGACGKTGLLLDEMIDEYFVCKKYVPYTESERKALFDKFVREIKLLHKLHHENLVRFFNYYLYPDRFTGYILMEFVDGQDIGDYAAANPEKINELFLQAISGFSHLEAQGILHRDIRPSNILVRSDGNLKIIDLGFGKEIKNADDFDKSISLNWWCAKPAEFDESRYDFRSEVYFVGKLFEKLIADNEITLFSHATTLGRMIRHFPQERIHSFAEIEKEIRNEQFNDFEFSESELESYRRFADAICTNISKIESGLKYFDDTTRVARQLDDTYRKFMLENEVQDCSLVINCFLDGQYYYRPAGLLVSDVRDFLRMFKSATEEKRRLILANLHTRFDCVRRYEEANLSRSDIPF